MSDYGHDEAMRDLRVTELYRADGDAVLALHNYIERLEHDLTLATDGVAHLCEVRDALLAERDEWAAIAHWLANGAVLINRETRSDIKLLLATLVGYDDANALLTYAKEAVND